MRGLFNRFHVNEFPIIIPSPFVYFCLLDLIVPSLHPSLTFKINRYFMPATCSSSPETTVSKLSLEFFCLLYSEMANLEMTSIEGSLISLMGCHPPKNHHYNLPLPLSFPYFFCFVFFRFFIVFIIRIGDVWEIKQIWIVTTIRNHSKS